MIYWAPFLHFYQPSIQFHAILKKICNESYRPLLDVFEANPSAKVTVNICGVLTELLNDHVASDVIERMKNLAERGQLEFTGTSKYHAILPLIPQEETERQIELNHATNKYFFKKAFSPKGFFPPEMCYSDDIIAPIAASGHKWILLSGIACADQWPMDKIYQIKSGDYALSVLFRDDILSNKISFQNLDSKGFIKHLKGIAQAKEDTYVITAMDAETFGHHIQNWEKLFLKKVYDDIKQKSDLARSFEGMLKGGLKDQIKVVTISELLEHFPKSKVINPKKSSWSTSAEDIEHKNFYPLWLDNDNEIHGLQWEHVKICIEMVYKALETASAGGSKNYANISRMLLDSALHSCQFWWASRMPMWDINLVNKGLIMQDETLLNAYKAIKTSSSEEEVKREYYHKVVAARDLRNKITDRLFVL